VLFRSCQYVRKTGHFKNWQEFGKWNFQHLLADKRRLPETTIRHVQELTRGVDSPKDKAKVLYKYMQDKTRYISIQVGIGGIEPFPAETVDQLGYGDCRSEEHTSELQSRENLVCRLLLENKIHNKH